MRKLFLTALFAAITCAFATPSSAGVFTVVTVFTNSDCSGNAYTSFLLDGDAATDAVRCSRVMNSWIYSYKADNGQCVVEQITSQDLCRKLSGS